MGGGDIAGEAGGRGGVWAWEVEEGRTGASDGRVQPGQRPQSEALGKVHGEL